MSLQPIGDNMKLPDGELATLHRMSLSHRWVHPRPYMSINAFMQYTVNQLHLVDEPCVVAAASMLVKRVLRACDPPVALEPSNVYLLWLVSLLMTCKMFLDRPLNNRTYGEILVESAYDSDVVLSSDAPFGCGDDGGLDISMATLLVSGLELEILHHVGFSNLVTPHAFCQEVGGDVEEWIRRQKQELLETRFRHQCCRTLQGCSGEVVVGIARDLDIVKWHNFTPFTPHYKWRIPLWQLVVGTGAIPTGHIATVLYRHKQRSATSPTSPTTSVVTITAASTPPLQSEQQSVVNKGDGAHGTFPLHSRLQPHTHAVTLPPMHPLPPSIHTVYTNHRKLELHKPELHKSGGVKATSITRSLVLCGEEVPLRSDVDDDDNECIFQMDDIDGRRLCRTIS